MAPVVYSDFRMLCMYIDFVCIHYRRAGLPLVSCSLYIVFFKGHGAVFTYRRRAGDGPGPDGPFCRVSPSARCCATSRSVCM